MKRQGSHEAVMYRVYEMGTRSSWIREQRRNSSKSTIVVVQHCNQSNDLSCRCLIDATHASCPDATTILLNYRMPGLYVLYCTILQNHALFASF